MFETKMLFSASRHFTPLLLPLPPIFSCSSTESNSSCMSLTTPLFYPFGFLCQCARGSNQHSVRRPGGGKKKEKIVWTSVLFSVTSPKFKPVGRFLRKLSVFFCTSPGIFFQSYQNKADCRSQQIRRVYHTRMFLRHLENKQGSMILGQNILTFKTTTQQK